MEQEKKRRKKWGSGPVTLQGRIACELIELLVMMQNQYEWSNYEFVKFMLLTVCIVFQRVQFNLGHFQILTHIATSKVLFISILEN